LLHCPQCDFITQNEIFFNEHVGKAHVGTPTCPFCFVGFNDYPAVRKHCQNVHKEDKATESKLGVNSKKPCRYFKIGEGKCAPKFRACQFDHTIIPFNEREKCFHKQACQYKPNCIFFHPEGQGDEVWEVNKRRKVSQICHYAEKGETCLRSVCSFFHPPSRDSGLGFHSGQPREPPLMETMERMTSIKTPLRKSVIVMNNLNSRKEFPELSRSMEEMTL
jgi:hypothetical protein